MCDARVNDSVGWRTYECSRSGKYEVDVVVSHYDSSKRRPLTIRVCGQHKNMIGQGARVAIREKGERFDTDVVGQKDARGEAKNRVQHATWDYDSAKRHVSHENDRVGYAATLAIGELLDLLEDYHQGEGPLHDFVLSLIRYNASVENRARAYHELREAENEYRKITKKA